MGQGFQPGFILSLRISALVAGLFSLVLSGGCYSILNGWLDPTVVGSFTENRTNEIRTSLTLEDAPPGLPGAEYPAAIDHELIVEEYKIAAGDALQVEIDELRMRDVPFQAQVQVSPMGYVNLPVVGRVDAAGMTVPQFEHRLAQTLQDQGRLVDPQVTVNAVFMHNATFSIFGIGVSASNNAPLRAGTFPIRRPDTRVLEAINQVGGLNEFVTDVYVFRSYVAPADRRGAGSSGAEPEPVDDEHAHGEPAPAKDLAPAAPTDLPSAERELMDVVLEGHEEQAKNGRAGSVPTDEILKELEPDASDPLIWVDGEFVANPKYRPPTQEATPTPTEPPPDIDTVAPATRWARIAGDSSFRILRLSGDALRSGDPDTNIYVRPGDVIRVVQGEIGVFYVMGQVNRSGQIPFNSETITLKSAIASVGGLSPLAWPDRCTVYRRLGSREQMIQVNLDRIFAGKDPDFLIRRGDIINVGTHPLAPFLQRIRAFTLPNPINNLGYGFTYVRNFADVDSFGVRQNPANQTKKFPNLFP